MLANVGFCKGLQLGIEVLDVPEEQLPVTVGVEIPSSGGELFEHVALEFDEVASRSAKVADDFGNGEAEDGVGHVRQ